MKRKAKNHPKTKEDGFDAVAANDTNPPIPRGEEEIAAAVSDAEEVHDPLESLVERTKTDPGAPFVPETREQLAALKKTDPAAFESLRAGLKAAGCRVTELDKAIGGDSGDGGRREQTDADILIELAQSADLFHAPDGTNFADLEINGHRETALVRGRGFKRWLARQFYEATQGAPGSEAMQAALNVIEAKAHFDGPERTVYLRVGALDGKLYLDLCDQTWRAVEIDTVGWRVINDPPVRFRRAAGMQPLPEPVRGGSIDILREFLNVGSGADFVLAVGWLLAALREHGPYPVLVLAGEQGSAKSTFSKIMRGLIDPNTAPLRSLPRSDRDLFIAANNGFVIAFDNVSGLPAWLSDTLCRLATGGGFGTRQLYTDQDEMLFDSTRPSELNGIEDFVTRPDLADRALLLTLEPIPEQGRRSEKELWTDFEVKRPLILGALLDAVVHGLRRLPHTRLARLPRMADFALWVSACEEAFWAPGTFSAAYSANRDVAVQVSIDADPVASAVRALMANRPEWSGTATDLLGVLHNQLGDQAQNSKAWPDSPQALGNRLRRAATFLRKVGIETASYREGHARTRIIRITSSVSCDAGQQPSASSASSAGAQKANADNDFPDAVARTDDADKRAAESVRSKPLNSHAEDDADSADADGRTSKPGWKCRL